METEDYIILVVIGIILGILLTTPAKADEESLWLTTGEWSRHNDEDRHRYRQNNTGVGLQYDLTANNSVVFGWYNNSIYHESVYAGMTYTPWHFGGAKVGVAGVVATGYSQYVPAVPVGGLFGSYEYGNFGLNLVWLPTVVVAVQLKVRVWK